MSRSLAVAALLFAFAMPALAVPPTQTFGGRILFSDKPFPTGGKNEDAYSAALKKQGSGRLTFDKEKKALKLHVIGFFKKPLTGTELEVVVSDVTVEPKQLRKVPSNTSGPGESIVQTTIDLTQASFPDGSGKVRVEMRADDAVVALGEVIVVGQDAKFVGKVEPAAAPKIVPKVPPKK